MSEFQQNEQVSSVLQLLAADADAYFERAELALVAVQRHDSWNVLSSERHRDYYWQELPPEDRAEAAKLIGRLLDIAGRIADSVRNAPLSSEADQRDVATATKTMRSALLLRNYRSWTTEVLHDEGAVLGVHPPGQSDDEPSPPEAAKRNFGSSLEKLRAIIDLVSASRSLAMDADKMSSATRYRPGSAFIMMAMDKAKPELADVADTVKQVFESFDISAVRADDIEHEGVITTRIIAEIETAEFLFADLTGARPNVYYEVGYAHALKRRVMLYRRAGTDLHFDLAGYNCPKYENLRDLREKLTRRLATVTNRNPRSSS